LNDYVGQEHVKDVLQTAILSAKARGAPLDHVLLSGPPGLGKTTLANIIANEMGWKFVTFLAPSLSSPGMVSTNFTKVKPETVVFLDEIHRLRRPVQESLYPVLEDGKVSSWIGLSYIDLPTITVVGATTNEGKLERPFVDRFPLPFRLEYYNNEELAMILSRNARKLALQVDNEAIDTIVKRSKSTPRIGNNLLRRIQDYAVVRGVAVDKQFATHVLWEKLKIDELGLEDRDREYLRALSQFSNGIGVDALATILSEEVPTLEESIEPYLIRLGLVVRMRNGRALTSAGRQYLGQ
jgi:Holliday junction DNA helicase RuvB